MRFLKFMSINSTNFIPVASKTVKVTFQVIIILGNINEKPSVKMDKYSIKFETTERYKDTEMKETYKTKKKIK